MKKLKFFIKIIVTAFIFSLAINLKAQIVSDCKYLMVLNYLQTNEQFNKKIKYVFRIKDKKIKYVEFNVSYRIEFIGIEDIKYKIDSSTYGINSKLLNNEKLFDEKYFFEAFESEFLKKLKPLNNSTLYILFSQPIDNYLIVELGSFDPRLYKGIKFGLGMKIIFKFDSLGLVEHTEYSVAAYN